MRALAFSLENTAQAHQRSGVYLPLVTNVNKEIIVLSEPLLQALQSLCGLPLPACR